MAGDARFEPIMDRWLNCVLRSSGECMCECPFCGGSSSLQFNIEIGLWTCFRCDEKGNAKSLVRRLGGDYSDPVVTTEAIRKRIDQMRTRAKKSDHQKTVLEETYLTRFQFEDAYWSEVRGFSNATIKAFDLGYDPIKDRHTLAHRNQHGELLGIIYRLKGNVFPRYIYPEGFDRKGSLFGAWKITTRKVAVAEGSTDVVALYESSVPAVAQWGSAITEQQVRLLHELGCNEIVLFYDYDEAGLKALARAREMLDGFVVRAVIYDPNKYCWHKKLCGCGQGHTWKTIGKCQNKRLCTCGRRHEVDPGSLKKKERKKMYDKAILVGRITSKWAIKKSVG